MKEINFRSLLALVCMAFELNAIAQTTKVELINVDKAWSGNSVNATIFRKNSLVSSANYQFISYYDSDANVVLARRKHGSLNWEVHKTKYKGNIKDAHNVICIMVDGEGYLHMSWDHHNNVLNYCRSQQAESLEMGEKQVMIGQNEKEVTYPEFYRMPKGDLLFAYRDGGSGNGNLVMNKYSCATKSWTRLQTNLIDGEGKRNAYWQLNVDKQGTIHVAWVWRESPDVRSNHDMCYARSRDGGKTWEKSTGEKYDLPIKRATAEIAMEIPEGSNLINQTAITTSKNGNPFIATYYKQMGDSCTQFYIIYKDKKEWKASAATQRILDFELGGYGSRSIPISRPQLMLREEAGKQEIILIYRDEECGDNIVLTRAKLGKKLLWEQQIISPYSVGRWEPSYDSELFRTQGALHLYFQNVAQGQAETSVAMPDQEVGVLEVSYKK